MAWNGTGNSESKNLEGDSTFKNDGRENSFEFETFGRKNSVILNHVDLNHINTDSNNVNSNHSNSYQLISTN